MFEQFINKKSVNKKYADNVLSIEANTQIFEETKCIIGSNVEILIINSYNLPLRKFIDGKLITLPQHIHTLQIKKKGFCFNNYIGDFNQSLDYLHMGLENLILNSSSFNLPLDNLPQSLKKLKINCDLIDKIDVNYLSNLIKLESYTSDFVSIPKSVSHLILNNPNQILNPDCNFTILEINQLKFKNKYLFGKNKLTTLGPIPSSVEYLIIKSIQDYALFQRLPVGITTIQLSDEILKNSQNVLDNLPPSLNLIKILVDKFFFEFINDLIKKLENIDDFNNYNNSNVANLQRACEIFDITNKIKIPFGCTWSFSYD
jgi:hypothetical protein